MTTVERKKNIMRMRVFFLQSRKSRKKKTVFSLIVLYCIVTKRKMLKGMKQFSLKTHELCIMLIFIC